MAKKKVKKKVAKKKVTKVEQAQKVIKATSKYAADQLATFKKRYPRK